MLAQRKRRRPAQKLSVDMASPANKATATRPTSASIPMLVTNGSRFVHLQDESVENSKAVVIKEAAIKGKSVARHSSHKAVMGNTAKVIGGNYLKLLHNKIDVAADPCDETTDKLEPVDRRDEAVEGDCHKGARTSDGEASEPRLPPRVNESNRKF